MSHPPPQRDRARHEQERATDAEVEPGVLVGTGERGADDLDDRDRARDREVASRPTCLIPATVGGADRGASSRTA